MNEVFETLESSTGLKKPQIINYALYASIALVLLGIGNTFIVTMLGVVYPAFASFVALESADKEDDKQWLTYWVCFGAFQIVDCFGGIILSFIPFYFFLKLGFLLYLSHPKTMGATWVYNTFLSDYIKKYRGKVEAMEKNFESKVADAKAEASKTLNM